MKISTYIKLRGIQAILDECSSDLKAVRQHIFRQCDLEKKADISKTMKQFKNYLNNQPLSKGDEMLLAEFMKKLRG
ncbi:hypothetical protein HDR58_00655 [bacterium]|nr:hypothetical protein [bacterium]